MRVLAVDPGSEKCGVAVCDPEGIVTRRVVSTAEVAGVVGTWAAEHGVDVVLIGNRTGGKRVLDIIRALPVAVCLAEEAETTLAARRRYFRDHPPKGWRRLLPLSLQVPPEPYDDYAAAVIGERYLHARGLL